MGAPVDSIAGKPPTIIAEPFAPPLLNHVPSTRTQGNRFAVVTRAPCGRKTSKELVAEYGSEGFLSRHQAQSMFEALDVGTPRELSTRLLGGANRVVYTSEKPLAQPFGGGVDPGVCWGARTASFTQMRNPWQSCLDVGSVRGSAGGPQARRLQK